MEKLIKKTDWVQVELTLAQDYREIAIALLSYCDYDAFEELEDSLLAYIRAAHFDKAVLQQRMDSLDCEVAIKIKTIADRNWNAEWESQYAAVYIDDFCQIIASFQKEKPNFAHTIFIDPKMSFGTGQHETTRLLIRQMAKLDLKSKKVLDMGCGTAVLGLLAEKMGADTVLGIDIDPWSYENAQENIERNESTRMNILLGDATHIPDTSFDLILANINRNVLLQDAAAYASHLVKGGRLITGGYYEEDASFVKTAFEKAACKLIDEMCENRWLSLSFVRA